MYNLRTIKAFKKLKAFIVLVYLHHNGTFIAKTSTNQYVF